VTVVFIQPTTSPHKDRTSCEHSSKVCEC